VSFIDKQAIEALNKAIGDALRPLGISLAMEPTFTFDPNQAAMICQVICVVGDSAFGKLGETDEQRKAREDMSRLAKEQHEGRIDQITEKAKEELARLLKGEDIFEDPLEAPCPVTGEPHKMHPAENFCMDCNAGLE
jgi:hypothetical protein